MKLVPEKNPFIEIFQKQYDELRAESTFNEISRLIEELVHVDDKEIVEIFANELGNTWMLYTKKMKSGAKKIGAVCLKLDGFEGPGEVPTLVFADAYESYSLDDCSQKSHVSGIADASEKIFARAKFNNKVFDEIGGFDIDFVTAPLFDADDDIIESDIFKKLKMLYVIKTLDLAYRAVALNAAADRFRQLPKNEPFAFFAFPESGGNPILLCEISGSDIVH